MQDFSLLFKINYSFFFNKKQLSINAKAEKIIKINFFSGAVNNLNSLTDL